MMVVDTLIFSLAVISSRIELSSQSRRCPEIPIISHQPENVHLCMDQRRIYRLWRIPGNAFVQVYAEHIRKLHPLKAGEQYILLISQFDENREIYAVKIFGVGYALYDRHHIRVAIMTDGRTRQLIPEEITWLEKYHPTLKIPATGLPRPPTKSPYGAPARIPKSLQRAEYEDWTIPRSFNMHVLQNQLDQSKQFFLVIAGTKYNILRNEHGEFFAIRMFDQVHVLYNLRFEPAAFKMSNGDARILLDDEIKFFMRRGDSIMLPVVAEEVSTNEEAKPYSNFRVA